MRRKTRILLVVLAFLVALVGIAEWLAEKGDDETQVGWSPLYDRRVSDALVPVTSQAAYAGLQSAAAPCDTAYCNQTQDCQPTADCQSAVAACGRTHDCNPTSEETCSGIATCEGSPTCAGSDTCTGASCPSDTFDAEFCGPTAGAMTCLAARTCDADICDWPTYKGSTCTRPTCDGPTCNGNTCEGPTCYLTDCDVFDYGDAPQIAGTPLRYPTTEEFDGARHLIDGVYFLGAREDAEMDGQPAIFALGDDEEPYRRGDDEDGIWFSTTLNPGRQAVVIAAASEAGRLFAWVDYDMSGDWLDGGDAVFPDGTPLVQGYNWIVLTVPETATRSPLSYIRFRFTKSEALFPTGKADNGEVEDYRVPICATFRGWLMTDQPLYTAGEAVKISFYVNEISQVTLIEHRSDWESRVLWTSTVEAGRHEYPTFGETLAAAAPGRTSSVEMIATSLQSSTTVWLTTPYLVTR